MRIPVATYRVQFSPAMRFQDARAIVPYLSKLGISDIYASPIFKATPGSTHGYDVTDPDTLNPELGTPEEFDALIEATHGHQMGWLQDIVPNHMAYSSENWMLMDLFENGRASLFYNFFDIFRDHPDPELQKRLLAPFLSESLEQALREGRITLGLDDCGLAVHYFQWRFPLLLASYADVLWHYKPLQIPLVAGSDPPGPAFLDLLETFLRAAEIPDSPERRRQVATAKQSLMRLYQDDPRINAYLDRVLESFNRPLEGPIELHPLYILLEQQLFKLVPWQVASETINYRRFFYISGFIALCIQDPQAFERIHRRVFEMVRTGVLTGVRIDHIDGLYNPRGYLLALRKALGDCYIIVEKILELYEFLHTDWPIQGTSGYKFCNYANGLFCRRENEHAFTEIYHDFIGSEPSYAQLLYEAKKKILEDHMAGEVAYLTHLAMQLMPGETEPVETMRKAMTTLMAAFPVYRTYIDAYNFSPEDRTRLTEAIEKATHLCAECQPAVAHLVALLLSDPRQEPDERVRQARQYFLMRFQQFTGPAMAKGFEDTLLYVYNRFISLNEVGGDPTTFGVSLEQFHQFNERRARWWPHAMSALSTHDSKRGEDIRARLNVLSEIPGRWQEVVTRWSAMNECRKEPCGDALAPCPNDEYLLYQTLVGALPFEEDEHDGFAQRAKDFIVKAVREAKVHSNWTQPNEHYEAACRQFVDKLMDHSPANLFWPEFIAFQSEIADYGIYNSLSQTVLKIACPGLPDFYQGVELWDFTLVDPDNRRPVDFAKRAELLDDVSNLHISHFALRISFYDGRIKLFVILRGLRARREHRALFDNGDYIPAEITGARAGHVVAFFRRQQDAHALIVVPRFLTELVGPGESPTGPDVWEDTRIALPADAPSQWHDAMTGNTLEATGELRIGEILSEFPVAILIAG